MRAKSSVGAGAVSATLYHEPPGSEIWFNGGRIASGIGVRCVHEPVAPDLARTLGEVYPTRYAPTTFLMLDRAVVDEVGPLDEQFFAYWEDADYLWRVFQRGFGIWVARDVSVIHKVGQASGGRGSAYSNRQYYKNQILFAKKHFGRAKATISCAASITRIAVRAAIGRDDMSMTRHKLAGLWQGSRLRPDPSPGARSWRRRPDAGVPAE